MERPAHIVSATQSYWYDISFIHSFITNKLAMQEKAQKKSEQKTIESLVTNEDFFYNVKILS